MNERLIGLLKSHRLHVTEARINILSVFETREDGLTNADIESSLGPRVNRTTVYRTLQTFLQKGILHRVPTTSPLVVYAIHRQIGPSDHAHFVCECCGKAYCLEGIRIPSIELSDFAVTQRDFILTGKCNCCK